MESDKDVKVLTPSSRTNMIEAGLKTAESIMMDEDDIWSRYSNDKTDIGEHLAKIIRTLSVALPLLRKNLGRFLSGQVANLSSESSKPLSVGGCIFLILILLRLKQLMKEYADNISNMSQQLTQTTTMFFRTETR
ncbi:MAG: hypothetical protein WCK32_08790 [Chlorobiaceae bacterium]